MIRTSCFSTDQRVIVDGEPGDTTLSLVRANAWCGAELLVEDLSRMAAAGGPEEADAMIITVRYTCPLPDEGSSICDGLPEGVVSCTEETIVTASTPLPPTRD
jgi:hypothetical protein